MSHLCFEKYIYYLCLIEPLFKYNLLVFSFHKIVSNQNFLKFFENNLNFQRKYLKKSRTC